MIDRIRESPRAAELPADEFEPGIDAHRADVAAELGLTDVPADELPARLRTSLTDSDLGLLNEEGDTFDRL